MNAFPVVLVLTRPAQKISSRPNQLQRVSPQMPLLHFFLQLGFSDHAVVQAALHQAEEELFLVGVRVGVVGAGELVLAEQGATGAAQPVAGGNSWKVSAGR